MTAHKGKLITLQNIPMPADTITGNYISAGWLLAEMDKAGGKRAHSYIQGRAVTVGINAMSFHKPVFVGDLVIIETNILRQGRSSLTVGVEAHAERRQGGPREMVTKGQFTFVATYGHHHSTPITTGEPWQHPDFIAAPTSKPTALATAPGDDKHLSLRNFPEQKNTNYLGDIFGGWILAQMDKACAAHAMRTVNQEVATVGLEAMTFHKPVFVGDEVSFLHQDSEDGPDFGYTQRRNMVPAAPIRSRGGPVGKSHGGFVHLCRTR